MALHKINYLQCFGHRFEGLGNLILHIFYGNRSSFLVVQLTSSAFLFDPVFQLHSSYGYFNSDGNLLSRILNINFLIPKTDKSITSFYEPQSKLFNHDLENTFKIIMKPTSISYWSQNFDMYKQIKQLKLAVIVACLSNMRGSSSIFEKCHILFYISFFIQKSLNLTVF